MHSGCGVHICGCGIPLPPQDQYVFIHDALDEFITCGETDIAASNLRARVNKLRKHIPEKGATGFQEQFQVHFAAILWGGGGGGGGGGSSLMGDH